MSCGISSSECRAIRIFLQQFVHASHPNALFSFVTYASSPSTYFSFNDPVNGAIEDLTDKISTVNCETSDTSTNILEGVRHSIGLFENDLPSERGQYADVMVLLPICLESGSSNACAAVGELRASDVDVLVVSSGAHAEEVGNDVKCLIEPDDLNAFYNNSDFSSFEYWTYIEPIMAEICVPPTAAPTNSPSTSPSDSPSLNPTSFPSNTPSLSPSRVPSNSPSNFPTRHPSNSPTSSPTSAPSEAPSSAPTDSPTFARNCSFPLNVAFVLDTSCDMDESQCIRVKTYLSDLIQSFHNDTLYSLITYGVGVGADANLIFGFDSVQNTDNFELFESVSNFFCTGSTTGTFANKGLNMAISQFTFLRTQFPSRQSFQDLLLWLPVCLPVDDLNEVVPSLREGDVDVAIVASGGNFVRSQIDVLLEWDDLDDYYSNDDFSKDGYTSTIMPLLNNVCIPPTSAPSNSPSSFPSNSPSSSPSRTPSLSPSRTPSNFPSQFPSDSPTQTPSNSPSNDPTRHPSGYPSDNPSNSPSMTPSISPSISPSLVPSSSPSKSPSNGPSNSPTTSPSDAPSHFPSYVFSLLSHAFL